MCGYVLIFLLAKKKTENRYRWCLQRIGTKQYYQKPTLEIAVPLAVAVDVFDSVLYFGVLFPTRYLG